MTTESNNMEKDQAIKYLTQFGVQINEDDKIIQIPRSLRLGIKKWGVVDCLINYHGMGGWRWL